MLLCCPFVITIADVICIGIRKKQCIELAHDIVLARGMNQEHGDAALLESIQYLVGGSNSAIRPSQPQSLLCRVHE